MNKKKIKRFVKEVWRFPYSFFLSRRLKNHTFTIISADCIGGVLTHDLREQFRSPTINLIIPSFLTFVEDLERYLCVDPIPGPPTSAGYPTMMLDDISVVGVHYKTMPELIETWQKRKQRVNKNNIFVIASDHFIKTQEDFDRFDKLPYPKVCFVAHEHGEYAWQVVCPEFSHTESVGDVLRYSDVFGRRIFEKRFDCVKWLNQNKEN